MNTLKILPIFLLLILSIELRADPCVAGDAGKQRLSGGNYQYCDASDWLVMGGLEVVSYCSGLGKSRYQGSKYQYCDGTYWRSMKCGVAVSACASAGKQRYNSNQMQFCDGSNWYKMARKHCDPITVLVFSHSSSYTFAGSGVITFTLTNIGDLMSDAIALTQLLSNANYEIKNDNCTGTKIDQGLNCTFDVQYVHPPGTNQSESIEASDGIVTSPINLSLYSCDVGLC